MADLLASSPGNGRRDGIYPESMLGSLLHL
jgi:hypothetical protein